VPVLHRQREHRPVDPRTLVELRREDLAEHRLSRPGVASPHSRVEGGGVDDVEVEWVKPDIGDAERARVVPVPDLGERRTPLVDSYRPGAFAPGSSRVVPPLPITCESPRTPCADPTKMCLPSRGSMTIELIPRPRKASFPAPRTHRWRC